MGGTVQLIYETETNPVGSVTKGLRLHGGQEVKRI